MNKNTLTLLTIESHNMFGNLVRDRKFFKTKENAKKYVADFEYLDGFWQKLCQDGKAISNIKTKYQTVIPKSIELELQLERHINKNDKTTVYFTIKGYEPFNDTIGNRDIWSFEELLELDHNLLSRLKLFNVSLYNWKSYNLHYADFYNIKHKDIIFRYCYILQSCKREYIQIKTGDRFRKSFWQGMLADILKEINMVDKNIMQNLEYPDFLLDN